MNVRTMILRTRRRAQADGLAPQPGVVAVGELRDGDEPAQVIGFPSIELAGLFASELAIEDVRVLVAEDDPPGIASLFGLAPETVH